MQIVDIAGKISLDYLTSLATKTVPIFHECYVVEIKEMFYDFSYLHLITVKNLHTSIKHYVFCCFSFLCIFVFSFSFHYNIYYRINFFHIVSNTLISSTRLDSFAHDLFSLTLTFLVHTQATSGNYYCLFPLKTIFSKMIYVPSDTYGEYAVIYFRSFTSFQFLL